MDSLNPEDKAKHLELQGDKKRTGFQFFGDKHEDALELYTKAGNQYKLAKKWQNAGDCFVKCAECDIKLKQKLDAAQQYAEAANCYKKVSIPDAVNSLRLAIELYIDQGKFPMAARLHKDIATIYEGEMDLENAIEHYGHAASFFQGEESTSQAMDCNLKIAAFSAQIERYPEAIELFEQVALSSVDNPLLRFRARDLLLKAGLCHLAKPDTVGAEIALAKYQDMDPLFGSSREAKLFADITAAAKESDVDKFVKVVQEYDSLSKLDSWKTTLLLRIKKAMQGEQEGVFT